LFMHISEFDKRSATIRVLLYLLENKRVGITKIIKEIDAGQKAVYSSIEFLKKINLIKVEKNPNFPGNPLYILTEKGLKVAEHLAEVKKILEE